MRFVIVILQSREELEQPDVKHPFLCPEHVSEADRHQLLPSQTSAGQRLTPQVCDDADLTGPRGRYTR